MIEDRPNEKNRTVNQGAKIIKMTPAYAVPVPNFENSAIKVLNENLEKLLERIDSSTNGSELLSISSQKGIEFIPEHEIIACQASGSYTMVRLSSGKIITDSKGIRHYQKSLNSKYFFRTNRAWIVNLRMVRRFFNSSNELETNDGTIVPVSRDLVAEVKSEIIKVHRKS